MRDAYQRRAAAAPTLLSLMTEFDTPHVIGLDLGTGGARAVIVSATGQLQAIRSVDFGVAKRTETMPANWHEQDPDAWWQAAIESVQGVVEAFEAKGGRRSCLRALAIDGTSGTVLGVDAEGDPCTQALMYNDGRAVDEAREWTRISQCGGEQRGTAVAASWSLAKMRWLESHDSDGFAATHHFAHQADYIAAKLTGRPGITDASNALKSGFDPSRMCWPEWIGDRPELLRRLPTVVECGASLGMAAADAAQALHLPPDIEIIAGASDGTAGFLASGAKQVGDDNTTLGTTLVFKRLALQPAEDPEGLVYSHRLPGECAADGTLEARWLPGAASSVGGEWIRSEHGGQDLRKLDAAAAARLPIDALAYPLVRQGERFPFQAPAAVGFCDLEGGDRAALFAAKLQGVALLERLAYERLDSVTASEPDRRQGAVFATGGGSASDVWMQLRSDVSGRRFHRPQCPESAFGSAVLAAANTLHDGLWQAMRSMLRTEASFHPDLNRHEQYSELFARFRERLLERGYLNPDTV
ncbi:MAG: sugar (pentulose or hexulose) kinase [Planctomycetota bacterium]|jgi:sugar (pentulose or hexulose) kinase